VATAHRRFAPASRGWCTTCFICWPPVRLIRVSTQNHRNRRKANRTPN